MKKYVRFVVVLFSLLITLKFFSILLYDGKEVNYKVSHATQKFDIYEKYVRDGNSYYYFELISDNQKFNFRIPDIFNNDSYIIKDVHYYSDDDYNCVLPIFIDDSIHTDILCHLQNDKTIYLYRNLKNDSLKLDKFASEMNDYGYVVGLKNENITSKNGINIFSNMVDSHMIIIPSYNGLFKITDDSISLKELFKKDIYEQSIQAVVDSYYIVADYNESYSFREFKVVDLITDKVSTIYSKNLISMNSYVQGIIDDSVYIMDRSNKKQYRLDISDMTVTLIGNTKKGIQYYNGDSFENRSVYTAVNDELLFTIYKTSDEYDYIYEIQNIYYSYKKVTNGYDVYISYGDNSSLYTHAFFVSSIDRIKYIDDYVYFINNDTLYYFSPKSGINEVLIYSELYYNSDLEFWIYKK